MTAAVRIEPVSALRGRITAYSRPRRIPISAVVEIIATCNFSCQHCYIAPNAAREDVMSLEQAELIFTKLAAAGTLSLLLTGGEVFTHKQFAEIYLAAKRRGLLPNVNTNGYLIGERWADFLAEWPPEMVSISLYGLSEERYRTVTGIPNAFGRVVRALGLLRERGVKFELKCPAMTLTVDEIPAMRDFAAAHGASFRFDTVISPEEKGSDAPLALQLAPPRVVALEEEMDPGFSNALRLLERPRAGDPARLYHCGGGMTNISVNVHGGVSTCVTSRQTVGNLLDESFDGVWEAMAAKVERKLPANHPCNGCSLRPMCYSCPAVVEQVTGSPIGYVQQYCAMTHLKAFKLGLHPTGIPRTVTEGIPAGIPTARASAVRALPILSFG
ncbi:MAG: radical SAM protein [Gemmatimonadota bacterium]|nr:radical SAM protein [Gemmatimonadota bacterium]